MLNIKITFFALLITLYSPLCFSVKKIKAACVSRINQYLARSDFDHISIGVFMEIDGEYYWAEGHPGKHDHAQLINQLRFLEERSELKGLEALTLDNTSSESKILWAGELAYKEGKLLAAMNASSKYAPDYNAIHIDRENPREQFNRLVKAGIFDVSDNFNNFKFEDGRGDHLSPIFASIYDVRHTVGNLRGLIKTEKDAINFSNSRELPRVDVSNLRNFLSNVISHSDRREIYPLSSEQRQQFVEAIFYVDKYINPPLGYSGLLSSKQMKLIANCLTLAEDRLLDIANQLAGPGKQNIELKRVF